MSRACPTAGYTQHASRLGISSLIQPGNEGLRSAPRPSDTALMFGGVTRHGADLAFCRDLYTLDTGTMTWSEVKLGYSLPNARYGHAMGVVCPWQGKSWYFGYPGRSPWV